MLEVLGIARATEVGDGDSAFFWVQFESFEYTAQVALSDDWVEKLDRLFFF